MHPPGFGASRPGATERVLSQRRVVLKKQSSTPLAFAAATLMLAFALVLGGTTINAQGSATSTAAGAGQNHPAHIHNGTCDDLGDVVYPLENITDMMGMASPEASTPMTMPMGTAMAGDSSQDEVAISTSTIDVSLDDLLADDHAVNVHMSPEQSDVHIACGDISGDVENDNLEVVLNEVDGSGYSGHAELTDNGDDTTTVVVTVMTGALPATPMASPSS